MAELDSLMDDLPEELRTDGAAGIADPVDPSTATDEDTEEDEVEPGAEEEDDDSEEEDEGAAAAEDDEEEDDDYEEDLGEEEEPAKVETPAGAPKAAETDEGQFILSNLPKIKTNIIVAGADGKDQLKEVEVYGWGQLRAIPGLKGFASPIDQTDFLVAVNNNESRAKELQTEFRTNKAKADTEAYTVKENRGIARDLRALRQEGLFPKFKGLPGSAEFNNSAGAKEFDAVVAFMNEQNDEAGRAAQAGEAFYHISFRQAYRMLHPEQFNKAAIEKRRQTDKAVARRVKGGGGVTPPSKAQPLRRVNNITDLADDFAEFAAANGGAAK